MAEVDVDRKSIEIYVNRYFECQHPPDLEGSRADVVAMARWTPSGVETVARQIFRNIILSEKDAGDFGRDVAARMEDISRIVQEARSGKINGATPARADARVRMEPRRQMQENGEPRPGRHRMPVN